MKRADTTFKRIGNSFTTSPKLRRLTWHKQQTVRNRVYALQESFYPTKDLHYNAVKTRMVTLLGIVDRKSVLAYLGRPQCTSQSVMDQTVRYLKSGVTVPKRHYFKRKLAAKRGYIEVFNAGYIYIDDNSEWFIHWNHRTQLTLQQSGELEGQKASKVNLSLPYNTPKGNRQSTLSNQCEHGSKERKRRERYSKGERNCDSESNQSFFHESP